MRVIQTIFSLFVIAALASACKLSSEDSGSTPASNSTLDPKKMELGGSTIGNGLSTYDNPEIGVQFEYPTTWKVTESANFVSVDNSNSVQPDAVSKVSYQLLPNLKGEDFIKAELFLRYLKGKFPDSQWEIKSYLAGDMFCTTRVSAESNTGTCYFWLPLHKVAVVVTYAFFSEDNGESSVQHALESTKEIAPEAN